MDLSTTELVINRAGGPEEFRPRQRALELPGDDQLLIRQTAIGLNFVDIYFRRGEKPIPSFPFVAGFEAAGVVEVAGDGSTFSPGDRVAYVMQIGAYATRRLIPASAAVKLPDWLSDAEAAAVMLKGLTADYLVNVLHPVGPSDIVIVHAAVGGVGSLLCQWASSKGARVFGTVGSAGKIELARQLGCEDVFRLDEGDWLEKFNHATSGVGATVVYDGVGKTTFDDSLKSLRVRGSLFAFGSASGDPGPLDVALLNQRSIMLGNPGVQHFVAKRDELERATERLFQALQDGTLRRAEPRSFALADVASAHRALESRKTTGAVVMVP